MPNVSVVFLTKVSRIYFSGFCRFFKWRSSQIPEHLNDCAYLHLWLTLCSQHLALKGIQLKFITSVNREGECQAFWAWIWCEQMPGQECTSVCWKLTWTLVQPNASFSGPVDTLNCLFCWYWGPQAQPAIPMLSLLFIPSPPLFWAELKLNSLVLSLLKTDHWSPLEDRSLKTVKFRNPFMFVAFSLHFSESLTKSYWKSMLGVCLLKVAIMNPPLLTAMSERHVNLCL